MKFINEFNEHDHLDDSYLVINSVKGTSNTGLQYLSITFQDKTGVIEGKKWEATDADAEIFQIGNIVRIEGEVLLYRNSLQIKVVRGEKIDQDNIDVSQFILSAPVPQDSLERSLKKYYESINNPTCKAILKSILNDVYQDFIKYPAAVRNHHEYANGLLHHTVSMANMADLVCSQYTNVDRDMLLTGVILHDIGKTIELSGPIIPKYTLEGRLIGHISIMQSMIRETCKKLQIDSSIDETGLLLEHMILSHHGKYEFGSPILPLTREALLLNMIDDMDAKMNILDKALGQIKEGEFTPRLFPLDDRCFYKPKK